MTRACWKIWMASFVLASWVSFSVPRAVESPLCLIFSPATAGRKNREWWRWMEVHEIWSSFVMWAVMWCKTAYSIRCYQLSKRWGLQSISRLVKSWIKKIKKQGWDHVKCKASATLTFSIHHRLARFSSFSDWRRRQIRIQENWVAVNRSDSRSPLNSSIILWWFFLTNLRVDLTRLRRRNVCHF